MINGGMFNKFFREVTNASSIFHARSRIFMSLRKKQQYICMRSCLRQRPVRIAAILCVKRCQLHTTQIVFIIEIGGKRANPKRGKGANHHQLQPLHHSSSWICSSCRIAPVRERKVERHVRYSSLRCARPGVVVWLPNHPGVVVLNLPPLPCCTPLERTLSPLPGSLSPPFLALPISSFVLIPLLN
ncbi:uncharacterized protein DS421_16g547410 [Arachis hypogaea]|nr:uncharacterized protein DS421_16g547410 [Arachis hypogaea]